MLILYAGVLVIPSEATHHLPSLSRSSVVQGDGASSKTQSAARRRVSSTSLLALANGNIGCVPCYLFMYSSYFILKLKHLRAFYKFHFVFLVYKFMLL